MTDTETAACFFNPFCLRLCEWTDYPEVQVHDTQVLAMPYPNNLPNSAASIMMESSAAPAWATPLNHPNQAIWRSRQLHLHKKKMTKLDSGTFKKLHISKLFITWRGWTLCCTLTRSLSEQTVTRSICTRYILPLPIRKCILNSRQSMIH